MIEIRLPAPAQTRSTDSREFSIAICGDWAPMGGHLRALCENPERFYGDLLPVLRKADLAIVNLEGVIGRETLTPIIKAGISIRFPPEAIQGLTVAPFHLACLANNHAYDFGAQGYQELCELLKQNGVQSIGAGLTPEEIERPHIIHFADTRIGILNVAEGEEGCSVNGGPGVAPFDLSRIRERLDALRLQTDLRVVIAHAGREHLPVPAPYIRGWYRQLVKSGADLVVGHHPHVPQGMEIYQGSPIVYSLGNLALYIDSPIPYHRVGYFVKAKFRDATLTALELWPFQIEREGLHLLQGEAHQAFEAEWNELSRLIPEEGCLETIWAAYTDRWLSKQGLRWLSDALAGMGAGSLMLQSLLIQRLPEAKAPNLYLRLKRKILWSAIHILERRINFQEMFGNVGKKIQKGAANLQITFDAPAHQEFYRTALGRVRDGQFGDSPEWANKLLDQWGIPGI